MTPQLEDPDDLPVDLNDLPEWARKVMSTASPVVKSADPGVTDFVDRSVWPTLVSAAVVSTFTPRELTVGTSQSETDLVEGARTALGFAETVHAPDGSKWVLKQDARRSVLAAATKEDIQAAVERTQSHFADPISVALRNRISGSGTQSRSVGLDALEAARIATLWLGDSRDPAVPNLEQLNREIALRRLLQPFRQIIGIDSADGSPADLARLCFYGRDDQIELLRSYVGVLPAANVLNSISQFITNVKRAVLGPEPPMVVSGIGGVGKTTLIAKFTLEHAEAAASRYPFAYLDFDRATVSARRPVGLLIEMCQQVCAQFGELSGPLLKLQLKAQDLCTELDLSPDKFAQELETFERLAPLMAEFRTIVDGYVAGLESSFEFARPFLLVFDTFEIVQYSDKDVARIETFVRKLTSSEDGRGWARLRLIVSGRKALTKFLVGFKTIVLGPLNRTGSLQMATALAEGAGRPIDAAHAQKLVAALVGKLTTAPTDGVAPLTLKLVGKIFASAPIKDGNALADQLVDELTNPANGDMTLRGQLIDGILVRRILDHVADWRVRTLADPGLVVRRISPDVIRQVMARGTPGPLADDSEKTGDTVNFQPWELSQAEAEDIFEAFRREVSLVEPDLSDLRHRQDLRTEMLPLIKARRPNRFALLHKLAFDYFSHRTQTDSSDHAAWAEALYHGLWLGLPPEALDKYWLKSAGFFPRIDPAEFATMPEAHRYLLAKTGASLPDGEVEKLPKRIAVDWLVSKSSSFLDDNDPNAILRSVRAVAGADFKGLDGELPTAAIVARLLYRTGQWDDCRRVIANHLERTGQFEALVKSGSFSTNRSSEPSDDQIHLASLLRTWVTISSKVDAEPQPFLPARQSSFGLDSIVGPVACAELESLTALGWRLRTGRAPEWAQDVYKICRSVPTSMWQGHATILRFAVFAVDDADVGAAVDLLSTYFLMRQTPPRDREITPFIARALVSILEVTGGSPDAAAAISRGFENVKEPPERMASFIQEQWNRNVDRVGDALRKQPSLVPLLRYIAAFDHYDWCFPLGNALTRALQGKDGRALFAVLAKENFLNDSEGNLLSTSGLDGVTIAQRAYSYEGLGRLASLLGSAYPSPRSQGRQYPQTVFDIAQALLRWHSSVFVTVGHGEKG